MRKLVTVVVCAVIAAADPPGWIVPGRGIGPYRASMTRAQLEKLVPEGQSADDGLEATLCFMDPQQRIEVHFSPRNRVQSMTLHGLESVWTTHQGITLGTTLTTLQRLNRRPFTLHGWDSSARAGQILSWNSGRLARTLGDTTLTFATALHGKGPGGLDDAAWGYLESNRNIASSDRRIHAIDPVLETIELRF